MASIKVAVRVRPISSRETSLTGSQVVVRTEQNEISLTNLKVSSSKAGDSRERTRRYAFDYCFDSSDPQAENYADQAKIYEALGQSVLDGVFSGYNACLVAYGQTASGKTYTMMGTKEDPGLTPRLCEGLFARVEAEMRNERVYCVSVSYLEIYNERVRDLLKPAGAPGGLRVREHPRFGPYVQGLTRHLVHTLGSLMSYVEEGSKARKTASTLQNPSSSRSHALLTIALSEEPVNVAAATGGQPGPTSTTRRHEIPPRSGSKLHLVDLAGSESAATCTGVHRLKEGANINKSLVALGNVISALAERGSTGSGPGRRFIPYRDSSLTWLLKDALGGNATTIMLATISPASGSYNETSHTLRFAQRAQSVVNRPVINEDPVARIIRELKAEVARLKSLLLEKDSEETRSPCNCRTLPTETEALEPPVKTGERRREERSVVRRSNSIEGIVTHEIGGQERLRRYGSYDSLSEHLTVNYNRAKVTELKDEEINESVFVDIPTLVAVLIKPDESLHGSGAQIEEICSDEVAEDSIDSEFIEAPSDQLIFGDSAEKLGNAEDRTINSCHAVPDLPLAYRNSVESVPGLSACGSKRTSKLRKQDSIDIAPSSSNLETSKKFGSVEIIQRKREPLVTLERSETNLEKRSAILGKKLNNIREIDDQRGRSKALWRGSGIVGSKEHLQRKGSNDSDKSLKDSPSAKSKGHARKPSLENLKRKTSKDSSSSSSKDEQILISSLPRDKLLRRKGSFEQEGSPGRAHTPIQRTKRAEIVAAVTERLYSSRKHVEEGGTSGVRSPPEGTDVKATTSSVFSTRSKLQELSRKMLAKRRRVCVDTQTDILHTVRVKDTGSLTELEYQDAAVLTDNHETCDFPERRIPTLRVKEIATLTDKPKSIIVRSRDVGSLATDFQDFESDIRRFRNDDSGILSDEIAESNVSSSDVFNLSAENDGRPVYTDSSTNTSFPSHSRNSAVQVPQQDTRQHQTPETGVPLCVRDCCKSLREPQQRSSAVQTTPVETVQIPTIQIPNLHVTGLQVPTIQVANPEKNVISISLPDMISITIESTNMLESRVAVTDNIDQAEEKLKIITRDRESQTDNGIESENRLCFKDFTRSTLSQTEGRVFRIENIFQDPKNVTRNCLTSTNKAPVKNSFTLTNSLGTSYVANAEERGEAANLYCELSNSDSFARDGLITEAFIMKKLRTRACSGALIHRRPWENWTICCPVQCVDYVLPTSSQDNEVLGSKIPETLENTSNLGSANPENSTTVLESNGLDHDHNFSDDSLDYNVNTVLSKEESLSEEESWETLCPPDVVAHTKKEVPKGNSSETDKESIENVEVSASSDFEESCVEFPKTRPIEFSDGQPVHDYKSLILGEDFLKVHETTVEGAAEDSSRQKSTGKKKRVSFSNSNTPAKRYEVDRGEVGKGRVTLKPIIKKKVSSTTIEEKLHSSNDETDDSLQETAHENTSNHKLPKTMDTNSDDVCRSTKNTQASKDTLGNSREKSFKFLEGDISEDTCSESDSYTSIEDEEQGELLSVRHSRKIVEEYLNEAVHFMRNMNSINEYINTTKTLEKYHTRTRRRRRNNDYIEYQGRRISLKDDTDKYLKEDEIVISPESYNRCIKGIERLEECIQRVDRETELLREKYGIDCESAGARLSLASPGIDPSASGKRDTTITDTIETIFDSNTSREHSAQIHPRNNNGIDDGNLEKRIFDQLMNAVDSSWNLRRSGRPKASDVRSRNSDRENTDITGQGYYYQNRGYDDSYARTHSPGDSSCTNYEYIDRTKSEDFDGIRSQEAMSETLAITNEWPLLSTVGRTKETANSSSRMSPILKVDCSEDGSGITETKEGILGFREKLRYPGSPRARFLELLRERRRIVESSRGNSLS